ncbi:MAG: bifunctional phosphoribosyl-AMP cyclohydrolase/phosphoribosyl-ATP diphosphatase HisIE [Mycobacteriales bacterium]
MYSLNPEELRFDAAAGTVVVVTVDDATGRVLMVAHADREALGRTIATGEMHYRSRRRGLWHKGATSGNVQRVVALDADCDGDTVLARVRPAGPACHNGTLSCFAASAAGSLGHLDDVVAGRGMAPQPGSYTNRLLGDGNLVVKKLGEECAEVVAAFTSGVADALAEEVADLFFHLIVALHCHGRSVDDVQRVLAERRRNAEDA